ncbi:phosphotransferase system, HPr-related protein [Pseudomonas daroniae]|uniref:Phosphotransferase system, HPr-related protein n=1 Tax=Phytopseudomonas daroniae TaxID=2487519 RepID=A0A4Q9QII6_9GAMM|nr:MULTISPECIES: phosphotransferase system, HPr-related protein [Pseudomonas]TBU75729.1 phosphotransferase system, HPr-related protein [Pseudomonas daroniae]TBU80524.1 phosphotransferase system, HPr-related protein [Pseudomonas sp. FRB 228]TBU89651.1 phosphotransferase system, HPr-related protein [Pseudomonas daroniae]
MSTPKQPATPREIDDIEDRMGSIEQLDFSERKDDREGRVGDRRPLDEVQQEYPDERVREAGQSGGETLKEGQHEDGVSLDDLSPETLIDDTGARSPQERGDDEPADRDLSIVGEEEIGGGSGLDEAELARKRPLDGEPWDGKPQS